MKLRSTHSPGVRFAASATVVLFAWSGIAGAQAPAPVPAQPPAQATSAPATAAGQPAEAGKTFSQEELDQLVAPIALYPDDLLAQVLMASTYPLEIVSAERWVKANPGLKDKALEDALAKQPWDAAVKSLTPFPQVLTMMSEKLEWTQKLGDAFLAQQKDVMATAQSLRAKAVASGNLKDSQQQKVVTEQEGTTTIIQIQPTDPQVVYVPTYNPTVVYGGWPYPAYPPYYYYPPGYIAAPGLAFATGVVVGAALWGNCNWRGGDVNVNVNRYNNFNKTNIQNGNWQHNAEHRGAVPYKNQSVAQKYDRGASPGAQSRDAYRGRAEAGQQSARGGAADRGASPTAASRESRGAGGQAASRDMSGTRSASAFDSGNRAQTQAASSRGSSSMNSARASSSASRPSGGASRSGGGGGRAGGGGGRGGGGRR